MLPNRMGQLVPAVGMVMDSSDLLKETAEKVYCRAKSTTPLKKLCPLQDSELIESFALDMANSVGLMPLTIDARSRRLRHIDFQTFSQHNPSNYTPTIILVLTAA